MRDHAITDHAHETGEISRIKDCGTIVLVALTTAQGHVVPVPFDRRPFGWLLDAEGVSATALLGRRASYDGEAFRLID